MRINTTHFGEIDVPENEIITFPKGILGFESVTRYYLFKYHRDSEFHILQGVDDPHIAFVLVDPRLIRPEYPVKSLIGYPANVTAVYVVVTVPSDLTNMTANLQAPIVIDQVNRVGQQVVLGDNGYGVRHNILAELQVAAYASKQRSTA